MSIRIGNPRLPVRHVANRGRGDIAQQTINETVGRYNRRYQEAMKTDGFPCRLWLKVNGTRPCTCSLPATSGQNHLLPLSPDNPDVAVKLIPPASDPSFGAITVEDQSDPFEPNDNPNSFEAGKNRDSLVQDETNDDSLADGDFADDPNSSAILPILDATAELYGGGGKSCAICGSTGHVDGFRYHNGQRFIFSADRARDYTLRANLNTEDLPHSFEMAGPLDHVTWDNVKFPAYFESIPLIRVCNNKADAAGVIPEFKIGAGSWQTMTIAALTALKGTSPKMSVRVRCVEDLSGATLRFTHLEIIYDTVPPIYTQFPQMEQITQWEATGPDIRIDAEIEPVSNEITRGSLIEDIRRSTLWHVINNKPLITALNQAFGNQATLQNVRHGFSFYNRFLIGKGRDFLYLPFRSLEPVQGGKPTG